MRPSRSPPYAYGVVLFLGAALSPFLLSLDGPLSSYSDFAFRRSLSSNGSLYSLKDAEKYANLQDERDIDRSIEKRAQVNDAEDKCSRLFLYLPDFFAEHGHGSQINTYIMGATTSTYLDRAMVLVEPPLEKSDYAGGSQFGCPVDAFRETISKTFASGVRRPASWEVSGDFPMGYSRLVRHPAWLSRGCGVPCAGTHSYQDWVNLSKDWLKHARGPLNEVTCTSPDGKESNVVVMTGSSLRGHFREHETQMIKDRPSLNAERWALNLGATPEEAEVFNNIKEIRSVWDFVLGLMNKAGFLQFQPWIARDVQLFLRSFDLPVEEEYDAIHVRRGDKLAVEARKEVVKYWRSQGHTDVKNLPTNYVPFAHYLSKWDGPETCPRNENGKVEIMEHNVYVATDDPVVVRKEIASLPNHVDQNTILWNECHQLKFYFNPTDDDAFHLNGDGEGGFKEGRGDEGGDSCFGRYHRNVASIADMMILSKARTFVGEYNSNWGRVIRTMRVRLNTQVAWVNEAGAEDGGDGVSERMARETEDLTRLLDTRVAWGPTRERAPGY